MKALLWVLMVLPLSHAANPVIDGSLERLACLLHPRRVWYDDTCYRADPLADPCDMRVPDPSVTPLPGWLWCLQGPECKVSDPASLEGCQNANLSAPEWYQQCREKDGAVALLSQVVSSCLSDATCQWSDSEDACVPRWQLFCPNTFGNSLEQCTAAENAGCLWYPALGSCQGLAADEEPCYSIYTATSAVLSYGRGEGACSPLAPYLALSRADAIATYSGFDAGYRQLCRETLNTGQPSDCSLLADCEWDTETRECDLSNTLGRCRAYDWPTAPEPVYGSALEASCQARSRCYYASGSVAAAQANNETLTLADSYSLVPDQSVCVAVVSITQLPPPVTTDDGSSGLLGVFSDLSYEARAAIIFGVPAFIFVLLACAYMAGDDLTKVYVVKSRTYGHLGGKHSHRHHHKHHTTTTTTVKD